MSTTLVEEDLEYQRDTGHRDPEWEAWLAMDIPCVVPFCDEKVEWLGNQHGCVRAFSCDPHTMRFASRLHADLSQKGYISCSHCNRVFDNLDDFFTAVRI